MSDPTALPNFPPPEDEHPLRGRVIDVLNDQQVECRIDDDGDVEFTVNDQKMFVRCIDGPIPAMRVLGQWRIGDDVPPDVLAQYQMASVVSLQSNLVKLGIVDEVLIGCVDHLVPDELDLNELLATCIGLVLNAVQAWHVGLNGGPEDDPAAGSAV